MIKKRIINSLRENWMLLLGIFLMICYVYSDVLFGNWKISYSNLAYKVQPWDSLGIATKGPILSDIIDNLIPTIYSTMRSSNFFQFWNGMVGLGGTEDISIIMYPFYYLYLLPFDWAAGIKSVLQILIAFLSMYLLLKEWKCGKFPAAMGGVVYTFSSSLVCWHGWPHSDVAMFAPFLFLLVYRLIYEIQIRHALWMAVPLYLMLVAGMPTFAAYFLYLLGVFMVIETIRKYRKDVKKIFSVFGLFSVSVVLAVMMSFPYTAQLLISVGGNGYAGSRAIQAELSLESSYLYLSFFPDWNLPLERHFNECTIYFGMIGFWMLLFSGIRLKEKKHFWFWMVSWLVLVLLIFTPVFNVIFTKLPAVNTSIKFRIIVLLNFVTALLVGFNLHDILDNLKYYKKRWYYMIPMLGVMITAWYAASQAYLKAGLLGSERKVELVLLLIVILGALLFFFIKTGKKAFLILLFAAAVYDLGGFAKSYFPYVEKGAADIPPATDSIAFLQENTQNGERFAAVGSWVMFPNMNVFYGLRDIRSHNFVNTNEDLKKLFKRMDEWYYTTSTRTSIWEINNYTLLKYLGVRYLMAPYKHHTVNYIESVGNANVVGVMTYGKQVVQEFIARKDAMTAVTIRVATYEKQFDSDENLTIVVSEKDGKEIHRETVALRNLKDNVPITVEFPKVEDSLNVWYQIQLENSSPDRENSISVWRAGADNYEGTLYFNGEELPYDLMLEVSYAQEDLNLVYEGSDGMYISEMEEYSERFQLIEEAYIAADENTVLGWMTVLDYYPETVFISEEYYRGTLTEKQLEEALVTMPSSDPGGPPYGEIIFSEKGNTEGWKVKKDADDCIEVSVTVEEPRFLLFNEYYDKNWKVYIDGEEAELMRANYIMRSVFIPEAGEHTVTFRYKPVYMYRLIAVAAIGGILFLAAILGRKYLQMTINRFCRTI